VRLAAGPFRVLLTRRGVAESLAAAFWRK